MWANHRSRKHRLQPSDDCICCDLCVNRLVLNLIGCLLGVVFCDCCSTVQEARGALGLNGVVVGHQPLCVQLAAGLTGAAPTGSNPYMVMQVGVFMGGKHLGQ